MQILALVVGAVEPGHDLDGVAKSSGSATPEGGSRWRKHGGTGPGDFWAEMGGERVPSDGPLNEDRWPTDQEEAPAPGGAGAER